MNLKELHDRKQERRELYLSDKCRFQAHMTGLEFKVKNHLVQTTGRNWSVYNFSVLKAGPQFQIYDRSMNKVNRVVIPWAWCDRDMDGLDWDPALEDMDSSLSWRRRPRRHVLKHLCIMGV